MFLEILQNLQLKNLCQGLFFVFRKIFLSLLVIVVKEFIKWDQQIDTILNNSLQEQKYLNHIFFLIVLKNEIILPPQLHKFEYRFKIKTKIS